MSEHVGEVPAPKFPPAERKGPDDALVVIQLVCKLSKQERERYPLPNLTAGDCLRQDVKLYEDKVISLPELLEHSAIRDIRVQVTL